MGPSEMVRLLSTDPSSTGIFTDFDGTMSRIVSHPDDAQALAGADEVLTELAGRFAVVGIISGRSLEDLRTRLAPEGVVLAGSYGLQRSDREGSTPYPHVDWPAVAEQARISVAGIGGVHVEEKEHGVAVHFRMAPDAQPYVDASVAELAEVHALLVRPGRLVLELTVPGPGKGEALADLASGLATFMFAGDDLADLEAFHRARELPGRSICVAVVSPESPPGLRDAADICLQGQEELLETLRELAAATGRRPG